MRYRASVLGVIAITLFWASLSNAATINAASCSQADVQTAVNAAVTGDIVNVPAGSCTWATAVSIPSTKKITLQGAGMDSTIITKQTLDSPNWSVVYLSQSGSRLTGFQFIKGTVIVDGDGWRIDHCKFYRPTDWTDGVEVRGNRSDAHPKGLIDHCYFHNTRVVVLGWTGLMAHALWAQPLNLGSDYAVYVEDNTFVLTVFGNVIDSNYGGRYVFRNNTVTDGYIEAHSVQGNNRAARSWEIYNNTLNQVSLSVWVPFFLRGGTGVVFNNTLNGKFGWPAITIDNVRSCRTAGDGALCNGTSSWDANADSSGYACRDQIGRSTDQWVWTDASPYPPQQFEPAYAWNNKTGTSSVDFAPTTTCPQNKVHIQGNRDFFNNTVKPGYAPYTYPHPLTYAWGSGATPPPAVISPPVTTDPVTTTGPTVSKANTNPKARFNR